MSRSRWRFTQRESTRALRGVAKSGVQARVEITPDGRLVVIPASEERARPETSERNERDAAAERAGMP